MIHYVVGMDEAGRGPWCGPVVACCLCFDAGNMPEKEFLLQIQDSKKLSHKKREQIFERLIEMSRIGENHTRPQVCFGIGIVDNYVIDEKKY